MYPNTDYIVSKGSFGNFVYRRSTLSTTMGCCSCFPQSKKNDQLRKSSQKTMYGASTPVGRSKSTMDLFMTHKERTLIQSNPAISMHTKLLLSAPFSNFSAFTEHIYLTSIGGITLDNLKQYSIKCLVNVAEEIPAINRPGGQQQALLCYKFPIVDSYSFQISDYLEQAADTMQKALKENDGNVVVYCTAGMCRSATIVLAYAIKYRKTPLKDAFNQLQEARNYARPNLAFFDKLIEFEQEHLGEKSIAMVRQQMESEDPKKSETNKARGKKKKGSIPEPTITVPDIYIKEYPHLFKLEVAEARVGNCPMVSNSSSCASVMTRKSSVARSKKSNAKKTKNQKEVADYQSNELKPFVVDTISYEAVISELSLARKKIQRKPSMQRTVSMGKSLKTKF